MTYEEANARIGESDSPDYELFMETFRPHAVKCICDRCTHKDGCNAYRIFHRVDLYVTRCKFLDMRTWRAGDEN